MPAKPGAPDYDQDLEMWIIGAIIKDPIQAHKAVSFLSPADFVNGGHQSLFIAIGKVVAKGNIVTIPSLHRALLEMELGNIDDLTKYAENLWVSVITSAGLTGDLFSLRRASMRRKIQELSIDLYKRIQGRRVSDPVALIDEVEGELHEIKTSMAMGKVPRPFGEIAEEVYENIGNPKQGNEGMATGFPRLDALIHGFSPGECTVLAARPSMGKSALALQFALNVAAEGGKVLLISLEMTEQNLMERAFSIFSQVPLMSIRRGHVRKDKVAFAKLAEAYERATELNLAIWDQAKLTAASIFGHSRVLAQGGKLKLVVVDYLQLIEPDNLKDSRNDQVARQARAMKLMSKELDCHVLLLSQLSRKVEERRDKIPLLSDLRDSGAIEEHADNVLMMFRPDYYWPKGKRQGESDIFVRKQRNGPVGEITLMFKKSTVEFTDVVKTEDF